MIPTSGDGLNPQTEEFFNTGNKHAITKAVLRKMGKITHAGDVSCRPMRKPKGRPR
jgi:hypothetical protein